MEPVIIRQKMKTKAFILDSWILFDYKTDKVDKRKIEESYIGNIELKSYFWHKHIEIA